MRLVGDPELDGGCLWVEFRVGPEQRWESFATLWPRGWKARFTEARDGSSTIELLDAEENPVAVEGQLMTIEGSWIENGRRLDRCHVGADRVMYVTVVDGRSHGPA
jgi:hypothetical protein